MTARVSLVSLGGDTLRLRPSNAHGGKNLVIGAARLALRDCGYLQMGASIDLSLFD